MRFHAFHGVMEQERIIGGDYLADLSYSVETTACETNNVADTVSYAEVYDIVKCEMSKPSNLIENVAYRIRTAIIKRFPQMQDLIVKISKLNPPVNGEVGMATVTIG